MLTRVAGGLLLAAPVAAAAQLPPAAELMAAHNRAIGGEAAFARHRSLHTTGTYSIPAAGMVGGYESWRVRPNRTLTLSVLPGMGELRGGFDGEIGWAVDPLKGARVLEGIELMIVKDQAVFDIDLRRPDAFRSAETVEKTSLGGEECYKVRLVWKSGRETFDCYGVASGLLIARIEPLESEAGRVEAITLLQDYAEHGGIRVPARSVTAALELEQVITIERVDFEQPDSARLALPAEIRALLRK
jgi:hypothetical protein